MVSLLITSGTHLGGYLASDFGPLPSALLPARGQSVYEAVIDGVGQPLDAVFMTLPIDYRLPPWRARKLAEQGVQVIRTDPSLSINSAVAAALSSLPPLGPVLINHGDSLIKGDFSRLIGRVDAFFYSSTTQRRPLTAFIELPGRPLFYETLTSDTRFDNVFAGAFSISNRDHFVHSLNTTKSWHDALTKYAATVPFEPIEAEEWLDFGSYKGYQSAKRYLFLGRHFNQIAASDHIIQKRSTADEIIDGEIYWYKNIPIALRSYIPQVVEFSEQRGTGGYALERLPYPTLAEKLVYGNNEQAEWRLVLDACFAFIQKCRALGAFSDEEPADALKAFAIEMYERKLRDRFGLFLRDRKFSSDAKFFVDGECLGTGEEICDDVISGIAHATLDCYGVLHGDFCASNILFDSALDRIKVVDPRGKCGNRLTIYGDLRYDLAKLHHSLCCGYDFALAGAFSVTVTGDREVAVLGKDWPATNLDLTPYFHECLRSVGFCSVNDLRLITVSLFLSMLPLHKDDVARQNRLLWLGLNLYKVIRCQG